jgi:hypothetical protein
MKLFVAGAENREASYRAYYSLKAYVEHDWGNIYDEEIYSIVHKYEGNTFTATVGKIHEAIGEIVIAIFRCNADSINLHLICAPHKRFYLDGPLTAAQVTSVEFFESSE